MPDALRPATQDAIAATLSFARRSDSRRRVRHADARMARITAARLIRHLAQSGFVMMQRPTAPAASAFAMPLPNDGGSGRHGRDR